MAFRFKSSDEDVTAGVRRIARSEIEAMFGLLTGSDVPKIVHGVRRRCKRLRGMIRLIGPGFKGREQENAALRDAARLLSARRDRDVMGETLDRLAEASGPLSAPDAQLVAVRLAQGPQAERVEPDLPQFRTRLAEVHGRIGDWVVRGEEFGALRDGFEANYRRLRKAMRQAEKSRAPAELHEWRKFAKYHWHHLGLLRDTAPDAVAPHRNLVDELGEGLGEHHNLAVLSATLTERIADLPVSACEAAMRSAAMRMIEIEERVFALGRQLVAEKPSALADRYAVYWADWRS